jgi:hypothetical protein
MLRRVRSVARKAPIKQPSSKTPLGSPLESSNVIDYIYDTYLPKEQTKSKADYYITPRSPFAKTPQEIKGIYSPFVQHAYEYCANYTAPVVYKCHHFDGTFYPPWHIIAQGRKSRPAIFFIHKSEQFNGNDPEVKQTSDDRTSKVPTDYAVWRNDIRKKYRQAFFDVYFADSSNVDGVYQLRTKRVPENKEELAELKRDLEKLLKLTRKQYKQSFQWVDSTNSKVRRDVLNNKLKQAFLPESPQLRELDWRG